MIRFLSQEEKGKTRPIYEECFPYDSKEFVDYYYQEKIKDNEIIVMEEEGEFQVMVHLNPYSLHTKSGIVPISYIVAVATRRNARKQGKMREVMLYAMDYLREQKQGCTFLMAAKSDYY
jgi:predicted acetyltransferase